MRVLIINSVCGIRSTGRICTKIAHEMKKNGDEVIIAYGRENVPESSQEYSMRIGSDLDVKLHGIRSRIFDDSGFGSKYVTKKFLRWIENFNPDMIWLHNLHGYYINIELLFAWLKKHPEIKKKWTIHDCWAFTGHCTYFSMIDCDRWKSGCYHCSQKKEYPASYFFDRCKINYKRKKIIFCGVENMELITPSNWLADLVRQSFLTSYPISVEYNTIDNNIFKPTKSDFRKVHNLENKILILGVASFWTKRKGLDDFVALSSMLNDNYRIILVGLTEKQIVELPKHIIGLKKTDSAEELAELYTTVDFFVNPSKEETFGLTTLEAISCGTKAIVYKGTACEEVADMYGGISVDQSVSSIFKAIIDYLIE